MRLVDKCDAMIGHVECMRKNKKWYKKLFYHLLDLSIVNSFNLYKEVTKNKITMREFSLECVRSFFYKIWNTNMYFTWKKCDTCTR